jgi:hypothetical protein
MIRRGLWLAVGAAGGIIGYRRAVSVGRGLSGTLMLTRGAEPGQPGAPDAPGAPRTPGPASRKRTAGRGLARQAIRLSRDVRRFSRDVREGMDLYLARHPGPHAPTLGASADNSADNHERVKDDR